MDPFQMPEAFCIGDFHPYPVLNDRLLQGDRPFLAQSTLMHTAWTCLVGLCGAMSCTTAAYASNLSSLRNILRLSVPLSPDHPIRKKLTDTVKRTTTLPFRISMILIFPLIILGLNIGFTLQLHATKPEDSLNCDATDPLWYVSEAYYYSSSA